MRLVETPDTRCDTCWLELTNGESVTHRIEVARDPDTPEEFLHRLRGDQILGVQSALARREDLPISIAEYLVDHGKEGAREILAATTKHVLLHYRFAEDESVQVRIALAGSPFLEKETAIFMLKTEKDPIVKDALYDNFAFTDEEIQNFQQ